MTEQGVGFGKTEVMKTEVTEVWFWRKCVQKTLCKVGQVANVLTD